MGNNKKQNNILYLHELDGFIANHASTQYNSYFTFVWKTDPSVPSLVFESNQFKVRDQLWELLPDLQAYERTKESCKQLSLEANMTPLVIETMIEVVYPNSIRAAKARNK